jgi:hypothetical protein
MPIKRDEASGFEAISSAVNVHYPDCRIALFNANNGFSPGADQFLEAVGVYSSADRAPDLLFVTYGFSDLHEKESEDPAVSGYGFELTLRLRAEDSLTVPTWPCKLFNTLARMVFQMSTVLRPGSALALDEPVGAGSGADIAAIRIVEDPELNPIMTANGIVVFLQIIAIRPEELTNFAPDETDGSITYPTAEWYFMTRASISLPVSAITDLQKHLMERLSNGLDLTIYGNDCQIVFRPAGVPGFNIDDSVLTIELPVKSAQSFLEKLQYVASVHNFEIIPVSIEFA